MRAGVNNPKLVARQGSKLYDVVRGKTPKRVLTEDWDNLFILDGCWFDLFDEVCNLEGDLQVKTSPASCTRDWLQVNFPVKYPDTIYISANPQTQIHGVEDRFHESVRIWNDCWDEDLRTTIPNKVADRSLDVVSEFPDKQLIIHFVQPRYPFMGEQGQVDPPPWVQGQSSAWRA